jgi:hypothetical protein
MTKTQILSAALGLALYLTSAGYAAGVGTTGAQFLKIGPGARAVGMGGAFSAVSDNLEAIYWNPAGLAAQKDRQALASYDKYFQGVNIGFLAYSQEIFGRGTMGIGLNYLTVAGIERRNTDVDEAEGTFGANDMALYLSYADEKLLKEYVKGLTLGANIKVIRQSIDTQSSQSFAMDLSALYKTPVKNLSAALGVYNAGTAVKFVDEADPLPLDLKLGGAYRVLDDKLLIACDIDNYVNDFRMYESVGAEYALKSMFKFRAGYKLGMDTGALGGMSGFSAGFGVSAWGIQLDYAFVPFGELDDTHRLALSTKF